MHNDPCGCSHRERETVLCAFHEAQASNAIAQADRDVPPSVCDLVITVKIPTVARKAFEAAVRNLVELPNFFGGRVLRIERKPWPEEAALLEELSALRTKIRSYDGGDRAPSPPARFLVREDEIVRRLRQLGNEQV